MNSDSTIISLFSGAGGFDLGFHHAGFRTCLANELLESAAATLQQNLGLPVSHTPASPRIDNLPVVIQGDVAEICFSSITELRPAVLVSGPPCQDYSVVRAQTRPGMNGKKGRLYSLLTSALAALQPKVLVFENVQGLLSADDGVLHRTILDDWQTLGDGANHGNPEQPRSVLGYEILFAKVVDAVRFGVPQTRKRFIVIGLRLDLAREIGRAKLGRLRRWLSVEMSGGRSLTARFPLTCLEALEGKPLPDLAARYRELMLAYKGLWEDARLPTAAVWRRNVWDRLTLQVKRDYLRATQIDPRGATSKQFDKAMAEHEALLQRLGWLNKPLQGMEFGDATNVALIQPSVQERMSRIPPGENHAFVAGTPWNVEGKGISFIYRRSFPLRPAFTVLAYGGGGTYGYHYARDRAQLTLRERARIQTFPDDFLFSGSSPAVRAQIGEAVPPLMAERIALMVREILSVVN